MELLIPQWDSLFIEPRGLGAVGASSELIVIEPPPSA